MLAAYLCLVLLADVFTPIQCWSVDHRLVAVPNGTAYLLESDGTFRQISSNPTRKILKVALDVEAVEQVSDEEVAQCRPSPLQSPELSHNPSDPDEVLRAFCAEIDYLEHPWYLKRKIFLGDYMNPSIVIWFGRPLLIYRVSYLIKRIILAWLAPDMSLVDMHASYFGIRTGTALADDGHQEDPRGYVLSDQRLLITYGQTTDVSSMIKYLTVEVVDGAARFSEAVLLKQPEIWQQFHKNWAAFEYNSTVMFFKYLNPPEIVAMNHQFTHNEKVHTVYGIRSNDSQVAHKVKLPWRGHIYGSQLRGSTPAIYVRGMLLAFFHTQAVVMKSHSFRKTYLMGVVAMCPHPPFNIIKSSKVPVMDYDAFYTGKWLFNTIDFVVFPAGVALSEDGETLWVSMGHQDRFGYILQFDVEGLLSSLHHHSDCDDDQGQFSDIVREGF